MKWIKLQDKRPTDGSACVVREVIEGYHPCFADYGIARFWGDGPDWEFARTLRSAHDTDEYIVIEEGSQ